jgi:hypothetical protein
MKSFIMTSLVLGGLTVLVPQVFADTLDPIYEDAPASFVVHDHDSFSGVTVSGKYFSQYRIVSDVTIRIHRFTVADHHFYISDRGVIEAENDLSAISIYLILLG